MINSLCSVLVKSHVATDWLVICVIEVCTCHHEISGFQTSVHNVCYLQRERERESMCVCVHMHVWGGGSSFLVTEEVFV
jgi:hypothetical protein